MIFYVTMVTGASSNSFYFSNLIFIFHFVGVNLLGLYDTTEPHLSRGSVVIPGPFELGESSIIHTFSYACS